MNQLARIHTRTLAHVLLGITTAVNQRASADDRLRADPKDDAAEHAWSMADDELWSLREEARQMIEVATGCTWASIERASL